MSPRKPTPPVTRFAAIGWTERIVREDLGPCWEWNGSLDSNGYAQFKYGRTEHRGHRLSWSIFHGGCEIPSGIHICHHCDNPPCVRPSHLFAGTRSDNMRDMAAKKRHPMCGLMGTDHPRGKLSDDQVRAIKTAFTGVRGQKTILAREYGVSVNHISWIIAGKRRGEVETA